MKDRLKAIRLHMGESQKFMADRLGVPSSTISKYERGEIKPTTDHLIKLAELYNVNINWLLTGSGTMLQDAQDLASQIQTRYELSDDEVSLIVDELLRSPATKDAVIKLLKAKAGNKEALAQIRHILTGMEIAFEPRSSPL